ncbi:MULTISPECIES: restriction endonuclease [unclassified Tolypothrix]|uniref:restriction endonuclease n=1 Tax=unclassified Tolypothrix TaxID=2649714 RepID=UPI0005EAAD55|nr:MULTISPECIES: restriction endonuclease [unclassified Tolypothrix]BAY94559.1 restriction endonuclease [Microchaete diplosiphon NIES-3275]EKE99239.1 TypeII site-specific deoxyribonuclease [Tolypothrix sp. PCC 7601]MBE9084675.1 restriction endonuclease [Tolypothrix sp. LEGE 11397]UYD28260.1 restriction endonuclease [Tolypothrix sp. PCC 7712]UYD35864.1 restriction endonuclease [Tolypothrix sp. PCC 7601]
MNGPKFVRFFSPVIEALQELGGSGRPSEVRDFIAKRLNISEQERTELLEGGAPRFDNQVAWARFYLVKFGLMDSSKRGVWSLNDNGRAIESLSFDDALLIFKKVHAEFQTDRDSSGELAQEDKEVEESIAPHEITINDDSSYRKKLLEILLSLPPSGFERLCQRLLRESGFEQVIVTGRSGDGGIDGHGILQINPFVSFKVLFQCKRYAGSVSSSQVRDFRGAMMGRADKGIIITTGTFTPDAQKEALRDGVPPLELVHGDKLLDMFENLELGLLPRKTFDVDIQFFKEFQS